MPGSIFVAIAAGVGVGFWVYKKTSNRGGGDFIRSIAPAAIAGFLAFLIALTILWSVF